MSSDDRPLVTLALVGFNQERFAQAAIDGALAQTWSPLQIVMSDDCSSDGTFALMEAAARAYDGPHTIVLNRNPVNLGIGAHVNRIMELAEGELIVVAACDDVSVAHRCQTLADAWLASGKTARSLHSPVTKWDFDHRDLGPLTNGDPALLDDVALIARIGYSVLGASHAWSRELFDRFGPLLPDLVNEDIALTLRAAMLGPIIFIDEPLVRYRVGNSSWHSFRTATADVEVETERTRHFLRLDLKNATQASTDAHTFGDPKFIALTHVRLRQAELALRIAGDGPVGVGEILAAIRAGVDPKHVIRCLLKFKSPWLYAAFLKRPWLNEAYLKLRGRTAE